MDLIEKIVYINLDHRIDRNNSIRETLKDYLHKTIRFSAIREKYGPLGATKSHIAVLEMAISQGWKNVLIMEDDMVWKNKNPLLEELIKKPYNVIVLGGACATSGPNHKLISSNSCGAYLVNQQYYETLLNNFKEGLAKLSDVLTSKYQIGKVRRELKYYTIDNYWTTLQHDNWFILSMFHGLPQYSDIMKKKMDYVNTYY